MKKTLIIIACLILLYFIVGGLLTMLDVCPRNINVMPGAEIKAWNVFCPFSGRVY